MRVRPRACLLSLLLACSASVLAADAPFYDLTIKPTGVNEMDQALLDASLLASLREEAPAGAFALVARASNDVARLDAVLRGFGYYDALIDIRLDDRPLDEPDLVARLEDRPGQSPIPIQVSIDLGPLYQLGEVRLDGQVPDKARAAFTLAAGQPALASTVLAAGQAVLNALREDGYALAQVLTPEVIVLHASRTMDVTYTVDPGPRLAIGPVTIHGLERLKEEGYKLVGPTERDGAIRLQKLDGAEELPRGRTDEQGPGRSSRPRPRARGSGPRPTEPGTSRRARGAGRRRSPRAPCPPPRGPAGPARRPRARPRTPPAGCAR